MKKRLETEHGPMEYILDSPVTNSDKGIIFIPGASGGGLGSEWEGLSKALVNSGYHALRFDGWERGNSFENKTIRGLSGHLEKLADILKEKGVDKIGIIGKCFGGGASFANLGNYVKSFVSWAAPIGVSKNPTAEHYIDTPFGEINKMIETVTSDLEDLNRRDIPIGLVHGTKDKAVPYDNSKNLASKIRSAKLIPIVGADHSYKDPKHRDEVYKKTVDFFNETL